MISSYGAVPLAGTNFEDATKSTPPADRTTRSILSGFTGLLLLFSLVGVGFFAISLQPSDPKLSAQAQASTDFHHSISSNTEGLSNMSELPNKRNSLDTPYKPPNIILVTLDDVGMNDLGWTSTDIPGASPRMAAMAYNGVILTNYYGQASCSPARATIMSGRYIHRTGFQDLEVSPFSNYSLPADIVLMPEMLSRAGYLSYGVGKWNIGHCNDAYLPWNRGFKSFLGFMSAGIGYFQHNHGTYTYSEATHSLYDMLDGDDSGSYNVGTNLKGTYDTLLFRDRSEEIIRSHTLNESTRDTPLFLWLAFHGVHSDDGIVESDNLDADNLAYLVNLKAKGSTYERLTYAKAMMVVDSAVGSVKDTLELVGMMNNTIMVVHSDNGAEPCVTEIAGNNMPYRSSKFQYFEGGVHVPAFIYAPGILLAEQTGRKYNGLMHHVDLYDTFAYLSGFDNENITGATNGINQWHAIIGKVAISPRIEIVLDINDIATIGGVRSRVAFEQAAISYIYTGMKLMKFSPTDDWYLPNETYSSTCIGRHCKIDLWLEDKASCNWSHFLFNLTKDPHERVNLYYDPVYSGIVDHMEERVKSFYVEQHFQNDQWGAEETAIAARAFSNNGDYVVPWGCPIQQISSAGSESP